MSALVRACSVNDVAAESAIPVEVPLDGGNGSTVDLAIVRSNGAFYAIYDECSHAQIPLSEGDVGDGEIECYLHGSRFERSAQDHRLRLSRFAHVQQQAGRRQREHHEREHDSD